jgi:peptide/nickel transport system substrate-binding protein
MRLRIVPALLALLATLAVAAGAAASLDRHSAVNTTVTLRQQQDWTSFDFMVDVRPNVMSTTSPAYDYLIASNPTNTGYVPYLATSWKRTAKSVTFTVRRDAQCDDGHKLTVIDVLNSTRRWLTVPKRTGSVDNSSIGVWGPGPFHLHANLRKSTFTIKSDTASRNLLGAFANLGIICPAGLAALQSNPRALETAMYGSGPYQLVSAAHGDQVSYKLRPQWSWGPKGTSTKSMPTNLVFKVVADDTTAANLLLTGGLDIADVSGPDVDRLLSSGSLIHKVEPNYYVNTLIFNMRSGRPTADDPKLRQALMTAVDPQQWNVAALAGRGQLTSSPFRPGSDCYDATTKKKMPKPSIDAAKQILQSDGYTFVNGKATKNGQTIKLTLVGTPLWNSGGEYLASAFNQLGIDLTFSNLAGSAYGAALLQGNFDISVIRGAGLDPEPGNNMSPIIGLPPSPAGHNIPAWGANDPVFNRYVNAAYQSTNCKYFQLIQQMVLDKSMALPMTAWSYDIFIRKGIDAPPLTANYTYPTYYMKVGGK